MMEPLQIRWTDHGSGAVFDAFFAGYEQAFTLPEEMEDAEGFRACLALNHGQERERLAAVFGPFRELCLTLHEADGSMAAGANLIALAHREGPVTVNLNYIYVAPRARGRGNLRRALSSITRFSAEAFSPPNDQVLVFIEQNDPLRMAIEDQLRDTEHSGMGQYDRLAIWGRQGARIVDFPYVQPPLSPDHVPNAELVLSVIGAREPSLPAAVLHGHLNGFFGISVAKGGALSPSAQEQLASLVRPAHGNGSVALIDPMPALERPRPAIGDWPDFRSFARAAASQAPISL